MKKVKKTKAEPLNKANNKPEKLTPVIPDINQDAVEENNFGGIPERDIRRNLGCG